MRNKFISLAVLFLTLLMVVQACSNEQALNYQRYFVNGKGLYEKNCQNCHGSKGEGLGKLYPPLTDTISLTKNKAMLACIIKNGISAKKSDKVNVFTSEMPGNSALADIDLAQIIVYVTNSFGNNQGYYDQAQVAVDLKNCK